MIVQLGLCRTWSEPRLLVFSGTGSFVCFDIYSALTELIYSLEFVNFQLITRLLKSYSFFLNFELVYLYTCTLYRRITTHVHLHFADFPNRLIHTPLSSGKSHFLGCKTVVYNCMGMLA